MSFPLTRYKSTENIQKRIEATKGKAYQPVILSKLKGASNEMKKKTIASTKKSEWLTNLNEIRKERFGSRIH